MTMIINGLRVVNATKMITVHVTPRDIAKGNSKDPGSCAAALACKRDADCTAARVHLGRTYLRVGDKWVRYITPRSLRSELISFDRGAKFEPSEYTFVPLSLNQRRGLATGSQTSKTRTGPKKKRAPYHFVTGVRPRPTRANPE